MLAATLLLISSSACRTTETWVVAPNYAGPVSTITPDGGVNPFRYFGGAAHAQIRSIDGVGAKRYLVQPGRHSFELQLRHQHLAYDGVVDLPVVPGDYLLTARRVGDDFDVSLSPIGGGPPMATAHLQGKAFGAPLFVPLLPLPLPGCRF